MKTTFIGLLDKSWPPEHSFVDGMLGRVLAGQPNILVRLCISRGSHGGLWPLRYGGASCIPVFYERRGIGRFLNLWLALRLLWYQISREKGRGRQVVLFVRNDPIYLVAAALLRRRAHRLVFQSSFPHEEFCGHQIKLGIAKLLYRFGTRGIDAVVGVSPLGLKRLQRLCPQAKNAAYIPLLSDLPVFERCTIPRYQPNQKKDSLFVYIGSHSSSRELGVVLQGVCRALSAGAEGTFLFIGAKEKEIELLKKVRGVLEWTRQGKIQFQQPIPRRSIPEILAKADVGITLIPPKPFYYEASPTKLAEYMGAGLAVLANRGIPLQERFIEESAGGILVDWDIDSIAEGIIRLCNEPEETAMMKQRSLVYAERHLQYTKYLPEFMELMGISS